MCISTAVSASDQTCQTISYGNHWNENEFRPYTGDEWGADYILKDTTKAKILLFFLRNCASSVIPVTIILDGYNQILYAANNRFSLTEVDCVIEPLLSEGETVTAPEETTLAETTLAETVSNTVTLY